MYPGYTYIIYRYPFANLNLKGEISLKDKLTRFTKRSWIEIYKVILSHTKDVQGIKLIKSKPLLFYKLVVR